MSKYLRITVFGGGGEYTYGVIEDKAEKQAMMDAIDNDEVRSSIYYEDEDGDEVSLESFNNADLLQAYGPDINGATLIVQECEDDSFIDDINDEILNESISELDCVEFCSSNPYADNKFKSDFSNDSLLWGTEKIEKRIHYPAELTLADNEEFDVSNVFIGSMNMDETINGAEIVDTVCYIRKDAQLKLVKDYLGKDYEDGDTLSDFIGEINDENKKVLEPFALDVGDIEGKGEYENDFSIVLDFEGETLYEGGEY